MIDRRQLLRALGLAGISALPAIGGRGRAGAGPVPPPPTRVVFFVTAHGHVPTSWMMPVPGGGEQVVAERRLLGLTAEDMSPVLRPLHRFRDRLLVIEGLANTVNLANIRDAERDHADGNNHAIAVAGLLTGNRALQRPGVPCTGGARSIDQELALRTAAPGRFGSRVYGYDYVPNLSVAPFSFLGPGQATPVVADPRVAFDDLMGIYVPPIDGGTPDRSARLEALRPSVLDTVAREYAFMAPRLDAAGRQRLDAHRALVRDLETSLGAGPSAVCDPTFTPTGDRIAQFMSLIRLAFACDLTRVATFVAPVPQCPEFGYPADATVHRYAHQSIRGATSCGSTYDPMAERAMVDLGIWYADHLRQLLEQLDGVVEDNGTLLDNTIVVWVSELATPTHLHHDTFAVIAGGGNAGFDTGRYVRYPRTLVAPMANLPRLGPASNRLHVTLLRAMGQPDTSFGLSSVTDIDGGTIPLTDPLTELLQV